MIEITGPEWRIDAHIAADAEQWLRASAASYYPEGTFLRVNVVHHPDRKFMGPEGDYVSWTVALPDDWPEQRRIRGWQARTDDSGLRVLKLNGDELRNVRASEKDQLRWALLDAACTGLLQQITGLHRPHDTFHYHRPCLGCSAGEHEAPWPCPTFLLLEAAITRPPRETP